MSLPRLVESDAYFGAVEVFRPDDTRSETLWGSELTGDGMYLQTNRPFAPGQRLGLAFELMGERVIIRAAEVVSVKPFEPVSVDGRMPGMEIRFVAMDPPYRGALRRHAAPATLSLVPRPHAPRPSVQHGSLPPDPFTDCTGPVPTPPPLERPRRDPAHEHEAAFEAGALTPLSLPPVAPLDDRTAVDLPRPNLTEDSTPEPIFSTEEADELRAAMAVDDAALPTDEEVFAMADTAETHEPDAPDTPVYASREPRRVPTGAPGHPLQGWTFHPVAPLNPALLHEPDSLDVPVETTDPWTLGGPQAEPMLQRPAAPASDLEQTAPPMGAVFEPGDISGVFAADDEDASFNEAALAEAAFSDALLADASYVDDDFDANGEPTDERDDELTMREEMREDVDDVFGEDSGELDLSFSDELEDLDEGEFDPDDDDPELEDPELEAFAREAEDRYDGDMDVFSAASIFRRRDGRRRRPGRHRALGVAVAVAGASLGVVLGLQTGPSLDPAPEAPAVAAAATADAEAEEPSVRDVADLERALRTSDTPAAKAKATTTMSAAKPAKVAAAPAPVKTAPKPPPAPAPKAAAPAAKPAPEKRKIASRSSRRESALPTPVFSAGSAKVALPGGAIVRAFGLGSPGRVVVDLEGVAYPGFIRQDVRLDGIAAFRVGRPDKEHVRVVIELEQDDKPSGIRAEKSPAGLTVTWR